MREEGGREEGKRKGKEGARKGVGRKDKSSGREE